MNKKKVLFKIFRFDVTSIILTNCGKENKIVVHSTICLGCNWMKTNPDIGEFIFSKRGAKRFAEIENKIFKE